MGLNKNKHKNKGSILLLALWSLSLLTIFAIILGYEARQKLSLVRKLQDRDKVHYAAEAALKLTILALNKDEPGAYDSLKDFWSNNAFFSQIYIDDSTAKICYNYILDEKGQQTEKRYGLIDEESKIDINSADIKCLTRLFEAVLGCDEIGAQELAASIIDWRDADSMLSIPVGSAEGSYYRGGTFSYEAKDAPFEVLDELLLVKGVTKDAFDKIKEYITIYSSGRVNINTARGPVLFAAGLSAELVDKILAYRNGEDGLSGTGDDNIFESMENIAAKISTLYKLNEAESMQIAQAGERYLSCNSKNFTASINVTKNSTMNIGRLTCVFSRAGKIKYWQED